MDQPIKGNNAPVNGGAIFTDKHLVGHAFMTLTQVKSTGEIVQRTIGFYPQSGGSPFNADVPGVFGDDSEHDGGWDVRVTISITGSEMTKLVNYASTYANANYNLNYRNCGNFVTSAVAQIGINVSYQWMNTPWFTVPNDFTPVGAGGIQPYGSVLTPGTTIMGPSIGALGQQLLEYPPSRATEKSSSGGNVPKDSGICN